MSGTFVVAKGVLSSELGAEHVLLNLNDGTYYGLEEVGSTIWTLLQQPVTVAELVSAVVDTYDVDAARCRDEIGNLLHDLIERGLVEPRP